MKKLKKILPLFICIMLFTSCNGAKVNKAIPPNSGNTGNPQKEGPVIPFPDLSTEESIREYLLGEWIFSNIYESDVQCVMKIDQKLNVQLSFYDTYLDEEKGDYTGGIKLDKVYADSMDAPDLIRIELKNTDVQGGEFFFLHRTIYDGKRVMSWFFEGIENCVFNVLGAQGYEDAGMQYIPREIMFEKESGEISQLLPRENDFFYAVYWGKGGQGQSLWLDDVWWEPQDEDLATVYPREMTYYENDLEESVLYAIAPEEALDILGDDLFPGQVYYVETDEYGGIIEFIGAERKAFLYESEMGYGKEYEMESLVLDIISNDIEEVKEYLSMGMDILFTGETIILDGDECYLVELGTDHEEHFVREIFYAVNSFTYQVYRYDALTDTWEPLAVG